MTSRVVKTVFLALAGTLLFSGALARASEDSTLYQYRSNQRLVQFVRSAAKVLAEKGEAAFDEFARKNGPWFHSDRYLFAYDLDGVCVLNAQDRKLEGKNLLELTDINGKKLVRWILERVGNPEQPYGWVHYLWPSPGAFFPAWKSAYVVRVKAPSGRVYALGSGVYGTRMEKDFMTDLVDDAAELVSRKGRDAFPVLEDPAGQYMFDDFYVYVFTPEGEAVVDPAFPGKNGRNILDFTDSAGKKVIRGVLEQLRTSDTARAVHMWPRPGEVNPSKQFVYARSVDVGDETFVVASHLFMETPIWLKY